jgi:phosphatidylglycerol:prolipoprotein diacylglycerol transferase
MHPILFKLGPFPVYSYGTLAALAYGIAIFLMVRRAPALGLSRHMVTDISIGMLVSGIIGARVLYILLNSGYYLQRPFEMLLLYKGGLVWYGGFFAGVASGIWMTRKDPDGFWPFADLAAPYLALAQGIGRLGCFLNGCCFGVPAPSHFPLHVIFPSEDIVRHPTQLYAAFFLIVIFMILRLCQEKRRFGGEIFLLYCVLTSFKRFLVEFLRGDNPRILCGLTFSQLVAIFVFVVAAAVFTRKVTRWKRSHSPSQ